MVLGDNNSCTASVMAKRMRIPTYQLEAGNRCFGENVGKRLLMDHIADDVSLAYIGQTRRNLLSGGLNPRWVTAIGSPMRELPMQFLAQIDVSDVLDQFGLEAGGYSMVSANRGKNVDAPARLLLLDCLAWVHDRWQLPTDSGTISAESSTRGSPAITLRESIKRPEALDSGSIMIPGLAADDVEQAVAVAMADGPVTSSTRAGYEIRDTRNRLNRFILSTTSPQHACAWFRQQGLD